MLSTNRLLRILWLALVLMSCSSEAAQESRSLIDIDAIYKLLVEDQSSQNNSLLFASADEIANRAVPSDTCELSCPVGCKFNHSKLDYYLESTVYFLFFIKLDSGRNEVIKNREHSYLLLLFF